MLDPTLDLCSRGKVTCTLTSFPAVSSSPHHLQLGIMSAYTLSAVLEGHKADVRSLAASAGSILSTSRDATAIAWSPRPTSQHGLGAAHRASWEQKRVIKEQEGKFVSCITTVVYQGESRSL